MTKKTEIFDIVDENDRVIGQAPRSECHGNPALVHRVAHVLVFNSRGELLLQKRSQAKDIQPGKWDTILGAYVYGRVGADQIPFNHLADFFR